jgi:gamma-glutamylcyclotransferase (GGCT)/AIG2-like uncharacterized protein YtfP
MSKAQFVRDGHISGMALYMVGGVVPVAVPSRDDKLHGEIYLVPQDSFVDILEMESSAGYKSMAIPIEPNLNEESAHVFYLSFNDIAQDNNNFYDPEGRYSCAETS